MTALCESIHSNVFALWACKETDNGARIRTTCLFPSFEPVFVYVARLGDGFMVHDAGETLAVIMAHGRNASTGKKSILKECNRYGLAFGKKRISLKIDAADWLETAIVSVANASAGAARRALAEASKRDESDLAENIFGILAEKLPKHSIARQFPLHGESGRKYTFDLAIQYKDHTTLIETVTSHANSVNSKYVALADVPNSGPFDKIVAHRGDLAAEDILLLQNVATVASPLGVAQLVNQRAIAN